MLLKVIPIILVLNAFFQDLTVGAELDAAKTKHKHETKNSNDLDTYTPQELSEIRELRPRVADVLTLEYMSQDKYLVRFIRASNHNLNKAESLMRENFKWRQKSNVDDLIHRNFSKFVRKIPFYFTADKFGRPALVSSLKGLNVRKDVIAGNLQRFRDYLIYAIERTLWDVHLAANHTGKEIIHGYLLFNMAGFTLRNQACIACMPLWIEMANVFERYYPQLAYRIIAINTPRIFQTIMKTLKPFTTAYTVKVATAFTLDKSEWMPFIHKTFPKEKLTVEFGGTAPHIPLYTLTPDIKKILLGEFYETKKS